MSCRKPDFVTAIQHSIAQFAISVLSSVTAKPAYISKVTQLLYDNLTLIQTSLWNFAKYSYRGIYL